MNNETKKTHTESQNEPIKKKGVLSKPWAQSLIVFIVIFGSLGLFIYWQTVKNDVYIENSYLDAPIVGVSPTSPGTLNEIYVKDGDQVTAGQAIALVGSETLYTKESGLVTGAPKVVGNYYNPGQTVASVVAIEKMRVVGTIDEDKGLQYIVAGQRVTFSVDTYPGRIYEGTVDDVSPVSNDTGVIFSISDKRPTRKFDVYVNFDTTKYPELKSGMSAKIYVDTRI